MALECTVCTEALTTTGAHLPRTLRSCGHTFCDECLRKLSKPSQAAGEGASIVCPTCRSTTVLSGQGVSELPRAYALLEYMKLVEAAQASEAPVCETCTKASAEVWCAECRVVECKICSDKEHAGRTGRTHSRVPWTPELDCSATTCSQHPMQPLNLVCRCQGVAICSLCAQFGAHREHTADLAADVCEKAKTELRERMQVLAVPELTRATAALSTVLKTLCGASATFNEEGKAVSAEDDDGGTAAVARRKIQDEFDALTLALQQRRSQLLAQVDGIEQEKRQCLESQLSALTNCLTTRHQLQHTAQRLLEAPPAAFMRDRPDLLQALEQVVTPCLSSAVEADISVQFAELTSLLQHGQVSHVSRAQRACMLAEAAEAAEAEAAKKEADAKDAKLLATMATVDGNGNTPLHIAAKKGQLEAVRELLRVGAATDARNSSQWTALIYAAYNGHTEVVATLIAANASLEAKDTNGWTALMLAACNGRTEVVATLIAANASLEAKDTDGWTALRIATQYSHTSVVDLLKAAGATL